MMPGPDAVTAVSAPCAEPCWRICLRRLIHAACLLVFVVGTAAAQEAPPGAQVTQPSQTPLAEVTVTGSRIKRTTDFTTPTPTTVIDSSTMENLGLVNVGGTLNLTPANVSTFTPANTGNAPFFIGAFVPDLRGLNPYFGSRTLTLVNTQRFVQTNQGDSVDLNFIPQILVDRIDVVTGGASAAYGSGAVAGVYNVLLNTKLEGGKLDADWYQTSHSDAKDRHVGAAYGGGLFDNRAHFVVGGEYENQDALGCYEVRSWCHANRGVYQTMLGAPGVATWGYGPDVRQNQVSSTGVFVNPSPTATQTLQGNPDGTGTVPFTLGLQPYQPSPFNVAPGGDGIPFNLYTMLMPGVNRRVVTGMLNSEVNDYLNVKTDVLWGKVQTTIWGQNVPTLFQYIPPDNGYLGPAGSPLATAVGPTGAFIDKDWTSQAPLPTTFTTTVKRFTFGLNGKIGQSSWTWDAYYEYGLTNHEQLLGSNLHLYASAMALDSVLVNGQPECRVTAVGFADAVAQSGGAPNAATGNPGSPYYYADPRIAQGCVPLNPFGNRPLSGAALHYAFGNLDERLRYAQTVAAFNVSGNYFPGIGAGPFSAAIGYEFRQELGNNLDNPGVPDYISTDFATQYGVSFGGVVTVHEGYLETNLPLAKNLPVAHLLELDLAARESRYNNRALYGIPVQGNQDFIHDLTTWKASVIWEPFDWLRFRSSQSRDARAANFRELYYAQIIHAGGVFGYCGAPGSFTDPCQLNLVGNVNLNPERSDTTTVGVVLTPANLIPGLQFSADWFHIRVKDAIEQANPTLVQTACRQGIAAQCNQLVFNSNPIDALGNPCGNGLQGAAAYQAGCYNIQTLTAPSYNGAFYEVRGIDFSLNYLLDFHRGRSLNTRLLTTWMGQQTFQSYPSGPAFDILGQTGLGNNFLSDYTPAARWRGSLLLTYSQGPLSVTPSMTFVSHGVMDYLGVTPAQGTLYQQTLNGTLPPNLAAYGFRVVPYNHVPSYFLFNLNASYRVENEWLKGLTVFAQVNNVFNKAAPFAGGSTNFGPSSSYGGTNPIFFDTLGLAYRVGFRLNF